MLEWAIAESGLAGDAVAATAGVSRADLDSWVIGTAQPAVAQLRTIARCLNRHSAVFLLPRPPFEAPSRIQYRHPIGGRRGGSLSDVERRFIRRARRLQSAEKWLSSQLGRAAADIPQQPLTADPVAVAAAWRSRLGVSVDDQLACRSAAAAFDMWQNAVEDAGISVLRFAMGPKSCRGFCLWDARAPLIALNEAWTDEARAFALFHALAHLITRTDSACAAAPIAWKSDALERWCEAFAAALLVPSATIGSGEQTTRLAEAASLARRHRVSLRAMVLRLIESGHATWAVYEQIPGGSDARRSGSARKPADARDLEYGRRMAAVFVNAVRRQIITTSQALDYLDLASADFERLAAGVPS